MFQYEVKMKTVNLITIITISIFLVSCDKKQEIINENTISKLIPNNEYSELIIPNDNNSSTIIKSEEKNIISNTNFDADEEKSSITSLSPLGENDYFELRFINYDEETSQDATYYINKITNGITELYYDTCTNWGSCQISNDKRKVLIKRKGNHDIYLLDGNAGQIDFKGTVNTVCCGSRNLDYLITSKWYDGKLSICVMNMNTFEEEYHFFWEEQDDRIWFYNILMYSEDLINNLLQKMENNNITVSIPEEVFDCVIIGYGMEGPTSYGWALLNVNTKEFVEFNFEFDM